MGKRKSRKKVATKVAAKVLDIFNCPFCNHERSVEVKMRRVLKTAAARCRVCKEQFSMNIHQHSAPIDVYCEWVDQAQKLNEPLADGGQESDSDANESDDDEAAPKPAAGAGGGGGARKKQRTSSDEEDDDDDDRSVDL